MNYSLASCRSVNCRLCSREHVLFISLQFGGYMKNQDDAAGISHCSVPGCNNNFSNQKNLGFYSPHPDRVADWLRRIKQPTVSDTPCLYICEAHFDPADMILNRKHKMLSAEAAPISKLPKLKNDPDKNIVTSSKSIQTEAVATSSKSIQTTNEHKRQISKHRQKLLQQLVINLKCSKPDVILDAKATEELNKFLKLSDKLLTKVFSKFINLQQHVKQKPRKQQYTYEYKRFLLYIYYVSPIGYKLIQNCLLLPTVNKLKSLFTPQPTNLGGVIELLKLKVDMMSEEQKQCTLCVGVIQLQPNLYYNIGSDQVYGFHVIDESVQLNLANSALVIMAQGLIKTWEQVVSIVPLADNKDQKLVLKFIKKIITILLHIGLNVRALILDTDTSRHYIFSENINSTQPCLEVNNTEIAIIYDVSHLIRLLRNVFKNSRIVVKGEKRASWDDIVKCYEHDCKKQNMRLVPKLTQEHMKPILNSDDTALAREVYSESTSAAVAHCVDLKILPKEAMATSKFLSTMNKLFDILNSSSINAKNGYKKAFRGEAFQKYFLNFMVEYLNQITISDNTEIYTTLGSRLFMAGFQTTILSILQLHENMKLEYDYILTGKLNLDNLNKYLNNLKQKQTRNPTFKELVAYFKSNFANNILESPVDGRHDNMEDIMIQAQNLKHMYRYKPPGIHRISQYDDIVISRNMYGRLKLPVRITIEYIAKVLYLLCLKQHQHCPYTDHHVTSDIPDAFVLIVRQMEEKFQSYFVDAVIKPTLYHGLMETIDGVPYRNTPCPNFPVLFLKKLFVRFRIFITLKLSNFQQRTCIAIN